VLSGGFLVGGGRWFLAKLQINLAQEIGKGRGKREMRNCWPFLIVGSFFFSHVTHLFENGRKQKISKLDVSRSQHCIDFLLLFKILPKKKNYSAY